MRLSDHWLALNTAATLFEVNLSGGHHEYKVKSEDASGTITTNDRTSQSYQMDVYLSLLNFTVEYEKTDDDIESYGGSVGLRLLGTSSQTTNFIARYGAFRTRNLVSLETWKNWYAEGQLQLYLIRHFGLQGKYRHYFPNESNFGTRLEGHRVTAGAFLEVFIFRLYADFYQEPMERQALDGSITKDKREGVEYGLKLFF